MAEPLRVKNPGPSNSWKGYVVAGLFVVPLLFLRHMQRTHGVIHFADPSLNLGVHALLIAFPLLAVAVYLASPLQYYTSGEETVLTTETVWATVGQTGWFFLMMLAAPLTGLIAAGIEVSRMVTHGVPLWTTTPLSAVFTLLVLFGLGVFIGTIFRERNAARVSEEGMRNGNMNFYEWENIVSLTRHSDVYGIVHKINPALPISYFRLRGASAHRTLDEYVRRFSIPVVDHEPPAVWPMRIAVLLATTLLVGGGLAAYFQRGWDLRWAMVAVFAASIVGTLLLESVRGVNKVTRSKPILDSATD